MANLLCHIEIRSKVIWESQQSQKSSPLVLVGSETAQRRWIRYEIKKAWEDKKGILGIRIHGLKDLNGNTSVQGNNPFLDLEVSEGSKLVTLGKIPTLKIPGGIDSKAKYADIRDNIEGWIEDAIAIRAKYN